MAIKGNRAIQHGKRKKWQNYVKTFFDEPFKSRKRTNLRVLKQAKAGLTPTDCLKPIVQCCTRRYNFRTRLGRGFGTAELKAVGLSRCTALQIGIAFDRRRMVKSEESLARNVERLKEYMAKVVVLDGNDCETQAKLAGKKIATSIKAAMPLVKHRSALVNKPQLA